VDQNKDRLLRAIRGLQLIQRTNAPNSSMAKAVTKALAPLLKQMADMPPDAAPLMETPTSGSGNNP
jgi:hypothetical protein